MIVSLVLILSLAPAQGQTENRKPPTIFQTIGKKTGISPQVVYRPQPKDIPTLLSAAKALHEELPQYKGREYYRHRSLIEVTLNSIVRTGVPGAEAIVQGLMSPDTDMETKILLTKAARRMKTNQLVYLKAAMPAISNVIQHLEQKSIHKEHCQTLLAIKAFIENDLAKMNELVTMYPHLYIWRNALQASRKSSHQPLPIQQSNGCLNQTPILRRSP